MSEPENLPPLHMPGSFKVNLGELLRKHHPERRPIVRSYVDWSLFYEGGYHSLIHGVTGAGKTTLLMYLLWILHEAGFRIIHRDDGNREFLYLTPIIPMVIWHPKDTEFELRYPERYPGTEVRTFTEPGEILDAAYRTPQRFHAILYDCYCLTAGPQARFYSTFFERLIYRCMQGEWDTWSGGEDEGDEVRTPMVASFDEINDLIPPRSKSLGKEYSDVLRQVSQNIRKLRKYRVTLMATVHRFNQLDLDVRSQFTYYWIKKSFGQDIYQFINRNLWTVSGDVYQAAMRFCQTMPRDQVLVFDRDGSYDKMRWPDIPRVKPQHRIRGEITLEDEVRKKQYDDLDLLVAALRGEGRRWTQREIAELVGLTQQAIAAREKKLWARNELLRKAQEHRTQQSLEDAR